MGALDKKALVEGGWKKRKVPVTKLLFFGGGMVWGEGWTKTPLSCDQAPQRCFGKKRKRYPNPAAPRSSHRLRKCSGRSLEPAERIFVEER